MQHWLMQKFAELGNEPAMIHRGQTTTYAEFLTLVTTWQGELERLGVRRGGSFALIGDYSPNACALMIASILNRSIFVPLSPSGSAHRADMLATTEAEGAWREEDGGRWLFSRLDPPKNRHPILEGLRERSAPGLIVFSTGSTGKSKAIVHDFDRVLEKFRRPRGKFRTLAFLLLDHFGGINTLLSILSSGGTVISLRERTAEAICQAVQDHRVQVLPTSPTFLNMLLISGANRTFDLSSLELITYGTEPMPMTTLTRLQQEFPGVKLKQTYGLSELGVLPTRSKDSGSLWLKAGGEGFETKIIDGILWIRSRSAMLGYLNAATPFDSEGWFCTEDAVEVDGEYIRIHGRTTEIINIGGEKVYPAEVESVILQMANVKDVTVRGRKNPVTGWVVSASVTLFEPEAPASLRKRLADHCAARLARYKVPLYVDISDEPVHAERFKKVRLGS